MRGPADRRVASGGVGIAVSETGDPDGQVIVFIHGYPDTKEMWSEVLARLPDRFHAIAYDVRGAGQSDRPQRTADYDFERLGDDLLAVARPVAPPKRGPPRRPGAGAAPGWGVPTQPRVPGRRPSVSPVAPPP